MLVRLFCATRSICRIPSTSVLPSFRPSLLTPTLRRTLPPLSHHFPISFPHPTPISAPSPPPTLRSAPGAALRRHLTSLLFPCHSGCVTLPPISLLSTPSFVPSFSSFLFFFVYTLVLLGWRPLWLRREKAEEIPRLVCAVGCGEEGHEHGAGGTPTTRVSPSLVCGGDDFLRLLGGGMHVVERSNSPPHAVQTTPAPSRPFPHPALYDSDYTGPSPPCA
ncbi:hypothetical protein B0H11DRAFT_2269190 [Mycena galericulata]|nr:hypothetical protein B0H11DRAFT_2269190 [Mycena galericulata]